MGLRTIHLKLHNPSAVKRKIIETAFINYNNAFNFLLGKAFENIREIEKDFKSPKGNYSTLTLSKWIDKEISAEINQFDVQPFKDSLKLDIGMSLASYLAQKKLNSDTPFPNFKNDRLRPIYFCRYDTKRSFCFLYDEQNNKYFTKLHLMNSKNAKERCVPTDKRKLKYISNTQQLVKCMNRETYIIIPLSFGKWQENMLKQAIKNPEIMRTAHLILKGNSYYLSLNIDLPEDERVEPCTYMGLSRGLEKAVNYTIADMNGEVIENGYIETESVMAADVKSNICILANKIVNIAVRNRSRVVLENLVGKGDKLSWIEDNTIYKPILGCKRYNELVRVLEYKLPQKGLPVPAKVSSVDIFHRCTICGSNTKKNRFSKTRFICTTCGTSYNLDSLGSINLANKLIKYENTPLKLRIRKSAKGSYLQNELIGLNLFVPENQDIFGKFKEEIYRMYTVMGPWHKHFMLQKLIKRNFKNIEII